MESKHRLSIYGERDVEIFLIIKRLSLIVKKTDEETRVFNFTISVNQVKERDLSFKRYLPVNRRES